MNTALLFPGQGAQYIGMCSRLIENYSCAADIFRDADDCLGFSLTEMILHGDMPELTHSANAQPAVVTASYALYEVFVRETGIVPCCGIGHSLGEISALMASGALSFCDGVRFARKRGEIMHRAFKEKRGRDALILELPEEVVEKEVREVCCTEGYVAVSCYNSPVQYIVAGLSTALKALEKRIRKLGGEYVPFSMLPMKVDAPYHSELMDFIVPELESELHDIEFRPFNWMVISTISGKPYANHHIIREHLVSQMVNPVKWKQGISWLETLDINSVVDIGPGTFIKNLFEENTDNLECRAYDLQEDPETVTELVLV